MNDLFIGDFIKTECGSWVKIDCIEMVAISTLYNNVVINLIINNQPLRLCYCKDKTDGENFAYEFVKMITDYKKKVKDEH